MSRGRRRYLVAYDVRDPARLRAVHKTVKGFGWSMQYSVFVCDLDAMELLDLKGRLADVIHHREDRVAMVDLGDPADRGVQCFSFMGVAPSLPTAGPVIL
jgi:CRISPR-associated protein Cas2